MKQPDLHAAALGGSAEALGRLLDAGADANEKGECGETALMLAAARGSAAIVAMLVDRGADVNAATDFGNTALMYAAARGQVDAVRVLLQRGALSGHKNKYGLGFVDWAKWSDRESEILAMLETPAPV